MHTESTLCEIYLRGARQGSRYCLSNEELAIIFVMESRICIPSLLMSFIFA